MAKWLKDAFNPITAEDTPAARSAGESLEAELQALRPPQTQSLALNYICVSILSPSFQGRRLCEASEETSPLLLRGLLFS